MKTVESGLRPGTPGTPSWIEVNLDNLAHNARQVKGFLPPGTELLAVVKADGYGHGAPVAARVFLANGASRLGVGNLAEGIALRRAGIDAPILVMGGVLPAEAARVVQWGLTPALFTWELALALEIEGQRQGARVKVHLKIDTGMGRYGLAPEEALPFARRVTSLRHLELEGIYTHLSTAGDGDRAYATGQLRKFESVLGTLGEAGIAIPLRHAANSAAAINFPESHYDLVRVGNLLYGQYPNPSMPRPLDLRPTWEFVSAVTHVREVARGESLGYGRDFIAPRAMTVAVLPVGLADGLGVQPQREPQTFSDLLRLVKTETLKFVGRKEKRAAIINGHRCPLVGRIGMQFALADVTAAQTVRPGDRAVLPVRRIAAVGKVPYVYLSNGRPVRFAESLGQAPGGQRERAVPLRRARRV